MHIKKAVHGANNATQGVSIQTTNSFIAYIIKVYILFDLLKKILHLFCLKSCLNANYV